MRVSEYRKAGSRATSVAPHESAPESLASSHALVVTTPAGPLRKPQWNRLQAPFLAQLIAVRDRHPQMRQRRCAEPNEAIASYRRTLALVNT